MSLGMVRGTTVVVLIVSLGAIWLGASSARLMTGGMLFLSFIATLPWGVAWLVGAVVCVRSFRPHRRASTILGILLVVSAAGLYESPQLGWYLRDRDFESYRPALERAVARLDVLPDSLLRSLNPREVVPEHPDRFYAIMAHRSRSQRLDVWFFYGGISMPPRHSAWIYVADSTASKEVVRGEFWHRARALRPHWYDASD